MENENLNPEQPAEQQPVEPVSAETLEPAEAAEPMDAAADAVEEAPEQPAEPSLQETAEVWQTPAPVKKNNTGLIVLTAVLCIALIAALVVIVLAGTGVIFNETPNTTVSDTTEPATTVPLDLKSYTVDDEAALANASKVVATAGERSMTNSELQVCYRMSIYEFINANSYYLPYMGVDFNQPLDQQVYNPETNETWQQAMLAYCMQVWHQYAAVSQKAEAEGFELDAEGQAYVDGLATELEEMAAEAGYASVEEMLKTEMGAGATREDYLKHMTTGYYSYSYIDHVEKTLNPTMDQLEQYFTENEESLSASGITKDSGNVVDVRHILIKPEGGTEDENGETVYSDEEWEACRVKAQQILDDWKAGEATEESFGALAKEHSADGNASSGGLYTGVTEGYMVETFNDWIFDESRVTGDTGLVKTQFGYHVMYFVKNEASWIATCRNGFISNAISTVIQEATEAYPMETDYDSVVIAKASMG